MNWKKRFRKKIGKAPQIAKGMECDTCFVCGQPFDKAPQIDEIEAFIEEELKKKEKEILEKIMVFRYEKCNEFSTPVINYLIYDLKL